LNGAEAEGDYRPANTPLTRIDELKKIMGWQEFTANPDWDEDLTVNSAGPIDLAWANKDVLLAIPGLTDALVDRFLELRRGQDGIDGTNDDMQFKSLEEIRAVLAFSPDQFKQLAGLIGFRDQVFRVTSVGKSSDARRTVQFVFRRTGATPQLITWKEF